MADKNAIKFPNHIFVTREDMDDTTYLSISEGITAEDALTRTDKTRVATYKLVEVKEGKLEPVFSTIVG